MAEAEVEQGDAPEVEGAKDGRKSARKKLQKAAEVALDMNTDKIVNSLVGNIDKNPVTATKMLMDLADGPQDEDEGTGDGFVSLAEVLWKALEELGTEDQRPGNR